METPSSHWFVLILLVRVVSANIGLGIPHASIKDFVYKGYFIPAGSTIHALEW